MFQRYFHGRDASMIQKMVIRRFSPQNRCILLQLVYKLQVFFSLPIFREEKSGPIPDAFPSSKIGLTIGQWHDYPPGFPNISPTSRHFIWVHDFHLFPRWDVFVSSVADIGILYLERPNGRTPNTRCLSQQKMMDPHDSNASWILGSPLNKSTSSYSNTFYPRVKDSHF